MKLESRSSNIPDSLKVAIVHDWMVSRGGAERVVQALHELWPQAPIYTAAYAPEKFPEFKNADVRTTWLNRINLAKKKHQLFSIPRALAFRSLNLSDYDVVISSSSAESKYVKTGPHTLHICYCYTPIRYYWSDYDWYLEHPPFGPLNPLAKLLLPLMIGPLRWYDFRSAQKVDIYLTQSRYIQQRIKRYYRRDAKVIYPPTDTARFSKTPRRPGSYYLIVGRQVAYKRLDLAVEAFNRLGLPLLVAGTGEEIERQKAKAKPNIIFKGFVPEADLPKLYAEAKAVVYPQAEDFGLVPIEAQAAGTPVIAYGQGGAAETIVDGETGVFFKPQTASALIEAVGRFEGLKFDPAKLKRHAKKFDQPIFKSQIKAFVEQSYRDFRKSLT